MAIERLVRQAVAGDATALSSLLDRYGPDVERKLSIGRAWRSVLDRADVMQVTYFEAFLRIASFDPDRADAFLAWLQRIAQNNLRDAIRALQSSKRPQPSDRLCLDTDGDRSSALCALLGVTTTTPSRNARRDERSTRLYAALDAMPEDYGEAVRLYDLESLPIDEVAKRMGRSRGAVHMLRARAHDRLREILGAESGWFTTSR